MNRIRAWVTATVSGPWYRHAGWVAPFVGAALTFLIAKLTGEQAVWWGYAVGLGVAALVVWTSALLTRDTWRQVLTINRRLYDEVAAATRDTERRLDHITSGVTEASEGIEAAIAEYRELVRVVAQGRAELEALAPKRGRPPGSVSPLKARGELLTTEEQQAAEMQRLAGEGLTHLAISQRLGCSVETVRRRLRGPKDGSSNF